MRSGARRTSDANFRIRRCAEHLGWRKIQDGTLGRATWPMWPGLLKGRASVMKFSKIVELAGVSASTQC